MSGLKVRIIGSGNWGSAFSRVIGGNVSRFPDFNNEIKVYVYEELVNGKKLTDIINETHVNVKYFPGYKLPKNVTAIPDLVETAQDADVLVFACPDKFIKNVCSSLVGKVKPSAIGISIIKGFIKAEERGISLISNEICRSLNINVSVLMSANIVREVADDRYCELTIGCNDAETGDLLKKLVQTDQIRATVVNDVSTVELCGTLKNIVSCAAGFVDGLNLGYNTKAAFIRLGYIEMIRFIEYFNTGSNLATFFESCGLTDLLASCFGGRNCLFSETFVKTGKSLEKLEEELLQGQKLSGRITAEEVNYMVKKVNREDEFPLFTSVHKIYSGQISPSALIDFIKENPQRKA